jgi:hypothetical protein
MACTAVGTYDEGTRAIAGLWNGAARKLYPTPSPPQSEPFVQPAALSCTGPSACITTGTDGGTLAEIWAGVHWRITPAIRP